MIPNSILELLKLKSSGDPFETLKFFDTEYPAVIPHNLTQKKLLQIQ